jgi:uncharacterized phage protein (TIGR02218 family)
MGFTDFSRPLTIDGVVYAANTGYSSTTVASSTGLSVDNMEVDGALASDAITENDITARKYDFAAVQIFQVNYMDLTAGKNILRTGVLGEITRGDYSFKAEIRGLAQLAQRNIGELYSDTCRAALGDVRCGIATTTVSGSVTSVNSDGSFVTNISTGNFGYGSITFSTGANVNVTYEVKSFASGVFVLDFAAVNAIAIGDLFVATPGCDGKLSTCINVYSNAINFRGEPNIPGSDMIYSYPS